jgi:hypothetical protein
MPTTRYLKSTVENVYPMIMKDTVGYKSGGKYASNCRCPQCGCFG